MSVRHIAPRLPRGLGPTAPDRAGPTLLRALTGRCLLLDGAPGGRERQGSPSKKSAPRQLLHVRSDPRPEGSTPPQASEPSSPSRSPSGPFGSVAPVPGPVGPALRRWGDWRCRSAHVAGRDQARRWGGVAPRVRFAPFEYVASLFWPSRASLPSWSSSPRWSPSPPGSFSSPPGSFSPPWICFSCVPCPSDVQVVCRDP